MIIWLILQSGGEIWALADWVEYKVLSNEFDVFRLHDLLRVSDTEQEEENTDFAEQDSINEELQESVISELNVRKEYLDNSYPFDFSEDGTKLILKPALTLGCYAYLYCLFFSHINRTDVICVDSPNDNESRDLMQICSTVAAAGDVKGNAISFGFPRPNNTNFLDALRNTYVQMGFGEVVDYIPEGAPANEKDGGIDVIAWSVSADDSPPHQYLLGQVASGNNWPEKSVTSEIAPFHKMWFSSTPPSTAIPAMFIPFCLDQKPRSNSQERHSLKSILHHKSYKYGNIYYRYNLPKFVDEGFELITKNPECIVERAGEFDKVVKYVTRFHEDTLSSEEY